MGNICCSGNDEEKKVPIFEATKDSMSEPFTSVSGEPQAPVLAAEPQIIPDTSLTPEELEQREKDLMKLREEQNRADLIVQATGRRMVAVRSTRGSNYFDQGFGAALVQHLEQTTQFAERVPRDLPPSHAESVYARLSQPMWDKIRLGTKDGENPSTQMDHVAESYLDHVVPKKERLFVGAGPIVENLL